MLQKSHSGKGIERSIGHGILKDLKIREQRGQKEGHRSRKEKVRRAPTDGPGRSDQLRGSVGRAEHLR